jgi:redox-sensing transcriptional repressor
MAMPMADHLNEIPTATVTRLVLYQRELQQLSRSGVLNIRSGFLADRLGLSDSQVRRDLSHVGLLGRRGIGYQTKELIRAIKSVLGTDRKWRVILIGMGNLGQALSGYKGFKEQGFELAAVFDSDSKKVGDKIHGHAIKSIDDLEVYVESGNEIQLAIIAVPAAQAATIASRCSEIGIQGILNFAPVSVKRHSGEATVLDVDLALELQRLAFAVVRGK